MGEAIQADWYDLDAADEEGFLDWLHNERLPELQARPGISWLGHHEVAKGTPRPRPEGAPQKQECQNPDVPGGCQYFFIDRGGIGRGFLRSKIFRRGR